MDNPSPLSFSNKGAFERKSMHTYVHNTSCTAMRC